MEGEQEEETVSLTGGETDNGGEDSQSSVIECGSGVNENNEIDVNNQDLSGGSETFDLPEDFMASANEKDDQPDKPETSGTLEPIHAPEPEPVKPVEPAVPELSSVSQIEDKDANMMQTEIENNSLPELDTIPVLEQEKSNEDNIINSENNGFQEELSSAPPVVLNVFNENKYLKSNKEVEGLDKKLAEVSDCPNLGLVDKVLITDVTTEKGTITVKECTTDEGFFAVAAVTDKPEEPITQTPVA